jgi:chemotaxis signal transduction protein
MKRAEQWRQAFDQGFAEPPPAAPPALQDFLAIRLAGQPHALRLDELAALQPHAAPTPWPGAPPALLGLVAQRGAALPLYDLAALLGEAPCAQPAWTAVLRHAPLALAFEGFDGHWRLPASACIHPAEHVGDALRGQALRGPDGVLRRLIQLAAVADLLSAGAAQQHL